MPSGMHLVLMLEGFYFGPFLDLFGDIPLVSMWISLQILEIFASVSAFNFPTRSWFACSVRDI